MASGRPDYHSYADIDIIAQSIQDIKNKPRWDNYNIATGLYTIPSSGVKNETIFTGFGEIIGGYVILDSVYPRGIFTSFSIYADNVKIANWQDNLTEYEGNNEPQQFIIPEYSGITKAIFRWTIRGGIIFNTKFNIAIINGATGDSTLSYNITYGYNS